MAMKLKRGTTESWNNSSLVLDDGQPGVERCEDGSVKMKIGDGEHTWQELPYVQSESKWNRI